MNNRAILILAALVLAICLGAVWFLQKDAPPRAPVAAATTPAPESPEPQPSLDGRTRRGQIPRPATTAKTATPKEAGEEPPVIAEWENKIDQALRTNLGEKETAQLLINMLPSMPPEGQAEAAQHISNLLLDEDYQRIAPMVKNPNMPEEVLDVFVTDLMNREDAVKLPVLLDIAKIPNHPHQEEAKTDLEIFLDEDYGDNWVQWEGAMKKYLAEQAAEMAAEEKAEKEAAASGAPAAPIPAAPAQ